MASNQLEVVTAIRDMHQEGFIAASLSRLGWKVSYRATDVTSLQEFLTENPDCITVASDDFRGVDTLRSQHLITLRGLAQPLVTGAIQSPVSDAELQHLMNSITQNPDKKVATYPKIDSQVIVLASIGRNVGTTVIATNFAAELALSSRSVLLIDCHAEHPSISSSLSIHGIWERIVESEFGFSATEVADVERIEEVSNLASQYECVVIDLGELRLNSRTSVGNRLPDVLTTWSLKSSERLHLVTDQRLNLNSDVLKLIGTLRTIAEIPYVDRIVKLTETLPKREMDQYKKCSEDELGIQTYIYPHDRRAAQAIRRDPRPLIKTAAKSLLRGQIQSHLGACENRVQSRGR